MFTIISEDEGMLEHLFKLGYEEGQIAHEYHSDKTYLFSKFV